MARASSTLQDTKATLDFIRFLRALKHSRKNYLHTSRERARCNFRSTSPSPTIWSGELSSFGSKKLRKRRDGSLTRNRVNWIRPSIRSHVNHEPGGTVKVLGSPDDTEARCEVPPRRRGRSPGDP